MDNYFCTRVRSIDIKEQPGLMISCDCFGELVPNFRFPAGKIYENLLNQANDRFEENLNIDSIHVSLKDFENAEKAKLIDTKLNKIIDPKNVSEKTIRNNYF
jgi:hypothetical protein